ncbi:MAG TPA: hypothetical protein DCG57_10990, partial [Candidatus Riflebacteria bacterium]|nr:hypothetical protein [Candidatus Riflebacteria bacterium]
MSDELPAVIDTAEALSLDNMHKLSDGLTDDALKKYLTGIQLPESEKEAWRKSFFSPYLIRENSFDFTPPPAPIGAEAFQLMCSKIPDLTNFPARLLAHLAAPETTFSGKPPLPSTVVFASATTSFNDVLDEAILWYAGGRLLSAQGRGQDAFRAFCGIINLALAWENDRLSHPDKGRRLKSCVIREIAAVGLIENAAALCATKAELISALAELDRLDKSFVKVSKVLAFDKTLPLAFARKIADDIASGTALKKYGREVTTVSSALADKKTLNEELDQIYDELVHAFESPYHVAQREYNPWQKRHDSLFKGYSFFFAEKSARHMILEGFTDILPFYTLVDVKTRILLNGAAMAMIINVYHAENSAWPKEFPELEKWLGQTLP